jgi:RNA polymerase sigma factor (sigma-70 family)
MCRKNATRSRVGNAKKANLLKKAKKKKRPRPPRAPLTEEQQGLAMRYLPMAKALAKPLKRAWPTEIDEFDSAACMALVEAAQSYDGSRNVKFATFARYRIWGALRDVQRGLITAGWQGDIENAPGLSSFTNNMEEHGLILGSEPDRPVEETIDAIDAVEYWLRKLPKHHAAACRQIYIHDQSQAGAANAIGCSKSRLSYLHKESIAMLNDSYRWKFPSDDDFEDENGDHENENGDNDDDDNGNDQSC